MNINDKIIIVNRTCQSKLTKTRNKLTLTKAKVSGQARSSKAHSMMHRLSQEYHQFQIRIKI